ncbi:malonate decarboxylase subunit epsilon [Paenibacillus sp. J2TS4]|uniref:malonate decarboxylase subunit epsilon n=1 Tax=Paenibacillus sp. J2TS4 TaxID=2807194 RepID=UPI001B09CD5A|nr:malonate decarboxylase subunit epsilon [Paenibacillus sp. J2TS4]GIP31677.1 malonyl CoA-acyl carrier protein transacylase [Paenibacillus sp. J2TS4]
MSTAFLFAGQGSQNCGMLHDLPSDPIITETLDEAGRILGEDVLKLDTAEAFVSTRAVQLALLIYEVAVVRLLKSEMVFPDIVAGHSVGAFAAAVACGALEFADAISTVEMRGRLMRDAYPSGFGMGVIIGLDENRVNVLTERVNTESNPVYIANINAVDQVTISGSLTAIQAVFSLARSTGAFTTKLIRISVPSHCRLLGSVSDEIAKKLSAIRMHKPSIPYVGNYRARVLRSSGEIATDLSKSVSNTVRWYEATSLMYERGVRLFMEIGSGEVLTNLARKAFPEARCLSATSGGMNSALLLFSKEKNRMGI